MADHEGGRRVERDEPGDLLPVPAGGGAAAGIAIDAVLLLIAVTHPAWADRLVG